jgi:D-alanyl-D-alanine carboxypeptidase
MEKIIYILILIILDNDFYKDIKYVYPTNYDFIVNKNNKLSENYVPSDLEQISLEYSCDNKYLRKIAKKNFEEMAKDAKLNGFNIVAVSTYRSYEYQKNLYEKYLLNDPEEIVNTYSARPGHSEHQTGLAIDITSLEHPYINNTETSFDKSPEYEWLKNNAHKYGFIIRYPDEKFNITGFKDEENHIRYVGPIVAAKIYNENITLEEYYAFYIAK